MSSNSIFGSLFSENRWVTEMSNTFPKENVVRLNLDKPPCVFRVPESLLQTKPEAYTPQKLGLGPYHHLRPDLYPMQREKLAAVMKFLDDEQLQNFQLVVEDFMRCEPFVRASYDHYLDLDPSTVAWILAIDAVFLLQFLKSYPERNVENAARNDEMRKLAGDILMLENQIPVFSLMFARRILKLSTPGDGDEYSMFQEFSFFCGEASPLKLKKMLVNIEDLMREGHLLNVMYQLIVTNRDIQVEEFARHRRDEILGNLESGAEFLAAAGVPGAGIVQQQLSYMRKIQWDRTLGLFKSGDADSVDEIDIPSVSQLTEIAGIRFVLTAGGIRDVKFDEREKKFHLPVITLHSNSEVILRNLLAYEAASVKQGSTLELAEYMDLMCGIVDSAKDVDILRKEKIVVSDLTDAEIATIFNGIKRSTGDGDEKTTNIEKTVEKVNKQYENIPRIKVYRFMEKCVPKIGKFLIVFSVILVLALFIFQAFCQVYGCDRRWFKKK